jgi:hypothetical protein
LVGRFAVVSPKIEVPAEPTSSPGLARKVGAFLLREFREILPPTIFFIVGFNLVLTLPQPTPQW